MALTPEEQAELQALNQEIGASSMKEGTASQQIGAGVDTGQALLQRAGQALSEVIGFGDSEFALNLVRDAQKNEQRAARVPAEDLGDQVLRGLGTLTVGVPPVLASLPFGGGAATAAGVLTSAGMNLGDIKTKSIELDPDSEASLEDVVAATALGSLEAIPFARFKRAMTPVSDGVKVALSKRLMQGAKDVSVAAATGGVTEGVQDFSTSVLAHNFTDTLITEERLDEIISNSIDEAAVGAILSGPIGATETTIKALQNNQAIRDAVDFEVDEDGRYVFKEPVDDKLQQDSLWKRGLANTVGRTPDKLLVSPMGGLRSLQRLVGKFVQNPTEIGRREGQATVGVTAELFSADMQKAAKAFFNAKQKVAEEAVRYKRRGEVPQDPEVRAAFDGLMELTENTTREIAEKAGLADTISWRTEKYIPIMNVDSKAVSKNPVSFRRAVYDDVLNNTGDVQRARAAAAKADKYARRLKDNGYYHYGVDSGSDIAESIYKQVAKAQEAIETGQDPIQVRKNLGKSLRAVDTSRVRKDNPFDQERFLDEVSEEFWENWTTKDVKGNMYSYIKATAERAAHSQLFGTNNEKYWQEVRDVIADAADNGIPVSQKDIKNLIDMINVSQRIPRYATSPATKKWVNRIRAFENMTLLPLAILPSLAETLIVTNRAGTMTGLTSIGKTVKESALKIVGRAVDNKKIDPTVADDLGLSFLEAQNVMASRLSEDTFTVGRVEQGFFNLTLLPQFTEFLRKTAANAAFKTFVRDGETFLNTDNNGIKRNLMRKFAEAGLDANKVADWVSRGALRTDDYYKDYIRVGLMNVVEDTVVNPKPINRPAWTSDQRFVLLGQMKSFALVFGNSVMRTWYDKLTAGGVTSQTRSALNILPLVATMVVFQVYMAAVREYMKTGSIDRWEDDDFWDHVLTGFSYMGIGGFLFDPLQAKTFGTDATSVLLGPAASDLNKAMAALGPILSGDVSPEDLVKSVTKRLTKSGPDLGLLDEWQ